MRPSPSIDRLRELFTYNEVEGTFVWRIANGGRSSPGRVAGASCPQGYVYLRIDGVPYRAHRLAWLYVYGEWPPEFIDHLNGNRSDNRIANLRLATLETNNQNRRNARKDSLTGLMGVTFRKKDGYYQGVIQHHGVRYYLGRSRDPQVIHLRYLEAKRSLHKGFLL